METATYVFSGIIILVVLISIYKFLEQRSENEELKKLNETKDQFITLAQHHLRSPITAIKWYAESMR